MSPLSRTLGRTIELTLPKDKGIIIDSTVLSRCDQLLWGGDYPHQESTFPRSRQIIEEILVDCTEEEKAKIAGGNAARVYSLN